MKFFIVLIIFLVPAPLVHAQTIINGKVIDKNGDAIPGANILIKNSFDGSSSAPDGTYSFETSEAGDHWLIVRFIGYAEQQRMVRLDGKPVTVELVLTEEVSQLEAVTITAGSFTASDEARRTVFKPLDIATTAGATADIAGALNTLPGTQKVGESGRLFVRGGDGSETRTFIDGMVVLDAYGPSAPNAPSRGRFLPFMFKGTSFSTGGYSAEYGQALSSALVLDSKDESDVTRTDVGILSVGADLAHTQAWETGSAAAKIQYTNIRPYFGLINQEIDWKKAPASLEGVAAFRQRVGRDGIMKLYGNFNQSHFSLYQHDIDDPRLKSLYDLQNNYRYVNGSYKTSLNKNWSIRNGVSYTLIKNETGIADMRLDETERGLHLKSVLDGAVTRNIELKAGGEILYRIYEQDVQEASRVSFNEQLSSLFGEADFQFTNKFVARTGGRLEYNSLTRTASVDPRLSLAYKLGANGQVSFAYGKFRQTAANQFVKLGTSLLGEKAHHYILNYQYVKDNQTFRIETFYKQYNDLVKSEANVLTNKGYGYARGLELFWRDNATIKGVDYWVSYSFLDTERDYLNYRSIATPAFASKHNLSVVGKYFIRSIKSQLGATWSYTSGRPYNDPNHDKFNGSRTPSYLDLSFNWSYLPKPYLILYFSCTNLLGRDHIFGYEYSAVKNEAGHYNGRAIRQAAPRFLFLGIFITLSKNKSFNQLPTL